MLTEAQEIKLQGVDVVVGYFEPHGRAETIAQTAGLEFVPRRAYEHRGSKFRKHMDTAAVIAHRLRRWRWSTSSPMYQCARRRTAEGAGRT